MVHDHGVAVAYEADHGLKLRPVHVFAGRLVGEGAIEGDAVELAFDVLVDAADSDVADPLPNQCCFLPECQVGF